MKRIMWLVFLAALLPGLIAYTAVRPPEPGEKPPEIVLPAPSDRSDRIYLGAPRTGFFYISDLKIPVVLIEILSIYCPYCQKEAPNVNKLHEMIEKDPGLRGKIKIIGIGAGNSSFETAIFRKKYGIPFPIFPDPDFVIHQQVGEVRTPYFIGVRNRPDGSSRIFYSNVGGFGDPGAFLDRIKQLSDLK
ncbi:MAG: peroxiredoxin family protein [Syntrophales bacterium]